jgi:hypothetical protein
MIIIRIFILLFKSSRRQVLEKEKTTEEKFHTADKHQLPSERSQTYLLTMFPVDKGHHIFNDQGEQEWQIQRDKSIKFVIYGT